MKHYETLMLLPVAATSTDLASIEKQLRTLVKAADGNVSSFDRWGRYKLAYPIRKQEYGCYVLARYEVADVQSFFPKLEHFLKVKCVDSVMRYVHVALTEQQYGEAYIKPEAMDGVHSGRDRRGQHAGARAEEAPVEGVVAAAEAPDQEVVLGETTESIEG